MADAPHAPLARPGRPGGVGWVALGFLVGAALSLAGLVKAGLLRPPAHASAPLARRAAAPLLPAPPAMAQAVEPAVGPTWSWTVPDAGPAPADPLAPAAAPQPAALAPSPAPAAPALRQASASAEVIADDAAAVGMTSRTRARPPG